MSRARTLHEEIAELLLDDYMGNPGAAGVLGEWRRRMKEGDYSPRRVAWIGQTPWGPESWPFEQLAAYLAVHTGLMSGMYAHVQISVGDIPGPDADRIGNAAKLQGVHRLFRAELDMGQHGADCDGWLSWDTPIEVEKSTGEGVITDCGTFPLKTPKGIAPGRVPLEVGSTKPSRTYLHLHQDGGVARWAYDDDRIALLVNLNRMRSSPRQHQAA